MHEERMTGGRHRRQDLDFEVGVLHHVLLDDRGFVHDLEGQQLTRGSIANLPNLQSRSLR